MERIRLSPRRSLFIICCITFSPQSDNKICGLWVVHMVPSMTTYKINTNIEHSILNLSEKLLSFTHFVVESTPRTKRTIIVWNESPTFGLPPGECNLYILINFQVFSSSAKMKISACLPSSLTSKLNAHLTRGMPLTVGIFIHKIRYFANVQAMAVTCGHQYAHHCRHICRTRCQRCHFWKWKMNIASDKLKIYNAIHKK